VQPSRALTQKGFTLVELLVTMAVAIVIGVFAAPSMKDMVVK